MLVIENQPAEILSASAGLLAGEDNVPWRHRRSRGQQVDASQWGDVEPARGIEPAHEPDHCDLVELQIQGMPNKGITISERRVADDTRPV